MSRLALLRRISLVFLFILLFGCLFCFADSDSSDSLSLDSSGEGSSVLRYPSSRSDDLGAEVVEVQNLRISPSDTSGLHAIILTLLGDYNPIAVTTSYQYPSGTGYQTRYQVDVEPDWSWISTAAIFLVIIFCVFKLVGGLFSCKR